MAFTIPVGAVGRAGRPLFSITLASNQNDYSLRTDLINNHGWNGTDPIRADVTIQAGVQVEATSTSGAGFLVEDGFADPTDITIVNNGEIDGKGGSATLAGGTALKVTTQSASNVSISFDNQGEINGGGGGGANGAVGGGATGFHLESGKPFGCVIPCAAPGGAGGVGGTGFGPDAATSGSSGGSGGCCGNCSWACGSAGSGGTPGGGKGQAGVSGGGAAGKSVDGDGNITWIATGTRNGPIA